MEYPKITHILQIYCQAKWQRPAQKCRPFSTLPFSSVLQLENCFACAKQWANQKNDWNEKSHAAFACWRWRRRCLIKFQRDNSLEFPVFFLLRVPVFKLFFRRITNQDPCNGCKSQQYKSDKKVVCQKHFQFSYCGVRDRESTLWKLVSFAPAKHERGVWGTCQRMIYVAVLLSITWLGLWAK